MADFVSKLISDCQKKKILGPPPYECGSVLGGGFYKVIYPISQGMVNPIICLGLGVM
jgi:hypothetical protein